MKETTEPAPPPDPPLAESSPMRPPLFAPTREVRFAVVMYGGVSLAIYINGVTQELLRLVRATAPAEPSSSNPSTPLLPDLTDPKFALDRVYRKLGQFLGGDKAKLSDIDVHSDPICTRFIVDILSGTSAGGINAIFLAKALANNQEMKQLKQLWLEEGDIAKLMNDKKSVEGLNLKLQNPPASLLNSQRMYRILLDAFDGMEAPSRSESVSRSCCVDELDLWVTTTDIQGLTLPLRLADGVVFERRHRNVFHFVYGTTQASGDDRNDFGSNNNPFLAFAARCTSAFPFAFEPMRLSDIDEVLATVAWYQGHPSFASGNEQWRRFFADYMRPDPRTGRLPGADYVARSFGDGGYLDNKPFSYATDTIQRRHADMPVDRKLIYVEPAPEHPEIEPNSSEKPDAIQNSQAALLTLPRYETIREDVERVLDRNQLIDRIDRATLGLEEDVKDCFQRSDRPAPAGYLEWSQKDLPEMIQAKGVSYGVYHRLKIAELLDDLATLFVRLGGFDEDSDQFLAVRYLVRAWRSQNFVEKRTSKTAADTRQTENKLLLDFDMQFRLRRLNFLRRKVDQLYRLDGRSDQLLQASEVNFRVQNDAERQAFREALLGIKKELSRIHVLLRRKGRWLRSRRVDNPLLPYIAKLNLGQNDLAALLNQTTEEERLGFAEGLLVDPSRSAAFDNVAKTLAGELGPLFIQASRDCETALKPAEPVDAPLTPAQAAHRCLWHYFQFYDDYDLVIFPVQQGTDVGEANTVEIIRISPQDAKNLSCGRPKLAGTALFNFGAFLHQMWRENDMLWGRLDAAERLIATLLPPEVPASDRTKLIDEAQKAIIVEELRPQDRNELCGLLRNALAQTKPTDNNSQKLLKLVEQAYGETINPKLEAVLRACLDENQLLDYYRDSYEVNRDYPAEESVRNLARATRITGQLLENLADRRKVNNKLLPWIARVATFACGLIEVSVPGRIPSLFFRHWLQILYLFEAFLILGGLALGFTAVQHYGLVALGITLVVHLLSLSLARFMKGRHR